MVVRVHSFANALLTKKSIKWGNEAPAITKEDYHAEIRPVSGEIFNADFGDSIRILYGGSAKPANVAALFSQPDVDGALIGGAGLKTGDFLSVVGSAPKQWWRPRGRFVQPAGL